ncbi:MAG: molecular chaperone DnaJ [Betaproteobacteria bacterium HGW-Betaproteobacteria-5]|jgi:molecular chaperone DnaJ|nr:MAG: molecular chaperone DnaJ [Betaproteobacteria bacterium HGW-Betaproteobacteria-5]PKO39459.1 MAG: molecular chaperone DnaJ [Betaproteobacteria bacterium HGW-Betaproteobacteria-6]
MQSMNSDPHDILGVSPGATPAELKRAYRRLAMRWHPDRSDHPHATERFKEIGAAYERLLAGDDLEDEEADAAPEETEAAARAADIHLNLEISLEEAAAGCHKTVHYARGKDCPTCDGTGEHGMSRTRFCSACHGSGRVHDAKRNLVRCEECGGRGLFTERVCKDCGGSGRELADVSLEIRVPHGMLPGDELRLAGQGEPGDDELQAGDLYLTLVIRSHPLFRLDGRDLYCRMPVSALAMIAGAEIELPSLHGVFGHALDAGNPERRQLRLVGKGYPGRGRSQPGDLIVDLEPVFPAKLNARQRKLLQQANAALMDDAAVALPEISAWQVAHGTD